MTRAALLLELTAECDRRCAYCYNPWRRDASASWPGLDWDQQRRVVQRAIEWLNPRSVTLIGGEPLLHPRLFDVLGIVTSHGLAAALSTHGAHVERGRARELARAGLRAVEVSFPPEPDSEAWAASCNALEALEAAGLPCTASIVLVRPGLSRLPELASRALASGAGALVLHPLLDVAGAAELLPLAPQWERALRGMQDWSERNGLPVRLSYPVGDCRVPEGCEGMLEASCQCGSKWAVDPAGALRGCEGDPRVIANLTTDEWMALDAESLRRVCADDPDCAGCTRASSCRRACPMLARPVRA